MNYSLWKLYRAKFYLLALNVELFLCGMLPPYLQKRLASYFVRAF